ncbi:MAG: leucine-rich repeat protein [Firmicutes bacterium]|nr:leucine-rich repeat protein [Bacillota bacterium]
MRKLGMAISFLLLLLSISGCASANSITISFETNGGNKIDNIAVDNIDSSFELPIPTKDGFTFTGWYSDVELTTAYTFSMIPATNLILYAKWDEVVVEDDSTDYTYILLSDNTYEITGYIGSNTTLVIPSNHLGKEITSIGSFAFYDCNNLINITIPSSVTNIGYSAFYNCSALVSITIPFGVNTIESNAFANCVNLLNITIPSSVVSIESDTFWKNNSLLGINVDEENQHYSSENGVLYNEDKTLLIAYPIGKEENDYLVPSSVTTIGQNAFANSTHLSSVSMSSNVISIEPTAFFNVSNLTNIVVSNENQHYLSEDGILFNKQKTMLLLYPKGKSANTYAIPIGITSIGPNAFENCDNLISLTISSTVNNIDTVSFWNNSNLLNIYVDDESHNYSSIDGVLFNKQKTVFIMYPAGKPETNYSIPVSVTDIASNAFANCLNLVSIVIPSNVVHIGDVAFYNCKGLTSITIPLSVTRVGSYLFEYCNDLTIFAEANDKPTGWDSAWNSHDLPVIWGYGS